MRHRLLATALLWVWAGPAASGDGAPLPPPGSESWQPVELPGVERATSYRVVQAETTGPAFLAEARCSASGLVTELPADFDLEATPVLRWRWRAELVSEGPDERTKPGDDFAARVSVMFPLEVDEASWLERARIALASRLAGREVPGTALYFVWTARADPGSQWSSPYGAEVQVTALERGAAREWRSAAVNVWQAYRSAFGRNPPRPAAVGLMTDSDNHCGHSRASYAGLEFAKAP